MNKILRYSFVVLLALACKVGFAQEVTLDFSDNTVWKLPDGNKNKATASQNFTNGSYTISVAGPDGYYYLSDKTNGGRLFYGKQNATVTLPKFSFDVERIDVVGNAGGSAKTTRNIFVGNTAVSSETTSAKGTANYQIASDYQQAGNVYTIKITNANNDQISKILVWKKGTAPAVTLPEVDNIAAFKALGSGTKGKLKLTNAKVQYASSTGDIYVVDATGGIDFYKTDLTYKAGQTLNGTITASYDEFNKLPELTNVVENKLTATDGTVEPIVVTVEEAVKAENICKLVTIKDVTLTKVGNSYYESENKKLQFYDKFKLGYDATVTTPRDFTGIILPYNTQMEIAPTATPTATGISTVNADKKNDGKKYNLNGQRVNDDYKGVYIMNGKKYLSK